jgi:hypothetical protein
MTSFTVAPVPASDLDRIRALGIDDFGNPLEVTIVQDDEGSPLRCCLRDPVAGERVALIAWQPFDQPGVYAEVGPVFIHAEACEGYSAGNDFPKGFRGRRQIFRAYGPDGRCVHNRFVETDDAESSIAELLARPEIEFIHSRNVLAGCYMFAIRRA